MSQNTAKDSQCRALLLAASASGQGKTTITAALARLLRDSGQKVRVFKTGPDYLDPLVLSQAAGSPAEQLDLWMAGEDWCRERLHQAAQEADIILVEGVMGMYDGEPSSADMAAMFNLPLAIVMNVRGMAQTTAPLVSGLAAQRPELNVVGLIANACGSPRHRELIEEALPDHIPLLAAVPRDPAIALPERHLGLVQATEIHDELEQRFAAGAAALGATDLLKWLDQLPPVTFSAPTQPPRPNPGSPLAGQRIAVGRDEAFSFIYEANLDVLRDMGAELRFFSPLHDTALPDCDALWLPGGYPELHAARFAANTPLLADIRQHYEADKPILAECGGLMACLDTLTDQQETTHRMLGLLPGEGAMRGRSGCQGMQTAVFPEGEVRAHAHHRSICTGAPEPIGHGRRQRHPAPGEAIYRQRGLTATYLHLFFPDNPEVVARLFLADQTTANERSNQLTEIS